MASELKVNTLTGVSTAGSIAVTAEGNSTTTNLQQGLAKAWCDYDSAGTTFNDSFNMTSATDNGTGDYTFTIANDLGGTRHSAVVSCTNGFSIFNSELNFCSEVIHFGHNSMLCFLRSQLLPLLF